MTRAQLIGCGNSQHAQRTIDFSLQKVRRLNYTCVPAYGGSVVERTPYKYEVRPKRQGLDQISADGTKLVATGVGRWFISTDSGRTWTSVAHELRSNVAAIALSADGSKVSAAVSGGYSYSGIYTSSAVGERTTAGVAGYVS